MSGVNVEPPPPPSADVVASDGDDAVTTNDESEVELQATTNRNLWKMVPLKVGSNPFKHWIFEAYSPQLAPNEPVATGGYMPGHMVNSFNGKTLRRGPPTTRLIESFASGKVKLLEDRGYLKDEFDKLVTRCQGAVKESKLKASNATKRKAAQDAAAADIPSGFGKGPPQKPGLKRSKTPPGRLGTTMMDNFVRRGGLSQAGAQQLLDRGAARMVYGHAPPYRTLGGPLARQFAKTCFRLGAEGFTLKADAMVGNVLALPKRQVQSGRLLDEQDEHYLGKLAELKAGVGGVDQVGYGCSTDGTTKYLVPMVNHALMTPPLHPRHPPPPDEPHGASSIRVVYLELASTRKVEKKSKAWQAQDLKDLASSKRNPFEKSGMYYATMGGACADSFTTVEKVFYDDPLLSNIVCMWCSTHGFHLLFEAIADIDGISALLDDVKFAISFARSHAKPTAILDEFSPRKGLIKWAATRMGTEFISMGRLLDLKGPPRKMTASTQWNKYAGGNNIKKAGARAKARKFECLIAPDTFFAKMTVTMWLTEPLYVYLRLTDSNKPTASVIVKYWLDMIGVCNAWGKVKFSKLGTTPAFSTQEFKMLSLGSTEASGKGVEGGWAAAGMANFRWGKMAKAGSGRGGDFQGAAFVVNPCFRKHELVVDDSSWARECFERHMGYVHTEAVFEKIMSQFESYLLPCLQPGGDDIFSHPCCLEAKSKGIGAYEFWRDLKFKYKKLWPELRLAAMRLCAATTSGPDSERHFSRSAHHHQKGGATLSVGHVGGLVFVREGMLNELDELTTDKYTTDWLERLEANNDLEVTEPPPPDTDAVAAAAADIIAQFAPGEEGVPEDGSLDDTA